MTITTPIKKAKVELKDWVTGFEFEEIQKPMTDVKFEVGSGGTGKAEINAGEASRKVNEKAIETVVVSVDGEKENTVKAVYDLPSKDYQFVLEKVNEVIKGDNFTKPE